MKKESKSAHARLLLAQGLAVAQVAEQTGLKPSEVARAGARKPDAGPRGGATSLDLQVTYARRIAQSAQSEQSRQLAAALLISLMTDALRTKIQETQG
jgi:hypothetical protein